MLQNNVLKHGLLSLFILIGISNLAAQKSMYYKERRLMGSTFLQESLNPVFLEEIEDSILFTTKAIYSLEKGDFTNYFAPNQSYKLHAKTDSYNRLSKRLVVQGSASYSFHKGKNVRGSSFLDPYKTPFNFIEEKKEVKGDRRIECYHFVGAISYQLTKQLGIGADIDYQSINFAKLKDIRNSNEILDLKTGAGVAYHISKHYTTGLSYRYKRYIEGFQPLKEGKSQKDCYAITNKGSFMGSMDLYDKRYGILNMSSKKPWVAIAHNISFQNRYNFSTDLKTFIEVSYEKEKGHFGDEENISVIYFKHNRKTYSILLNGIKKGTKNSHILVLRGAYEKLQNNEPHSQGTTLEGGSTKVNYYGENEIFSRRQTSFSLQYNWLWGGQYLQAPWHLSFSFHHKRMKRKASYYPHFRKQDLSWQIGKVGLTRLFHIKRVDFSVHFASGFTRGKGGAPHDGMYPNEGSTSTPMYMNELLYQEKEYLTAKRLLAETCLRVEHKYRQKMRFFAETKIAYTKPFEIKYLKGDYLHFDFAIGLAF